MATNTALRLHSGRLTQIRESDPGASSDR
jgi:hypothetical protein